MRARGGADDLGDRGVAWVAGRQLGLITTWQLRAVGVRDSAIWYRVRCGRLHRLHRGVFLVGHAIEVPGARELAAVLACGDGAFVSHRSAAALWALTSGAADEVELSLVGRDSRLRHGMRVRRLRCLDLRDRATLRGIPVTSPARTLIDFAAGARPEELELALGEARVRRLVTDRQLSDALERAGNRAGVGALRAALKRDGGPRLTRSEAERLLLRLIRDAKLPEPQANARVAGFEVDFLWPEEKVIVEVDGFAFHGHRAAFEHDRQRDMVMRDAGYQVIRVTWRQLVEQSLRVVAHIATALARSQFLG